MEKNRLRENLEFIESYKKASNAATGSKYDSNANVTQKNLSTLQCELGKKDIIEIRRAIMREYLTKLYGADVADQYFDDLQRHIIYQNDETTIFPYCAAISIYPFLLSGLQILGGSSEAPKHANSFIGGIINLIFMGSSQFAGALAIPEFFCAFDHFLRQDYGQDYVQHWDEPIDSWGARQSTLKTRIYDWFQQLIYSINQPAGARNYQSPFINVAYFDKFYFESIFQDYIFPDGDEPCWETTKELQKLFMRWFNEERTHSVLTFPVETANLLVDKDTGEFADEETADFMAEMWSKGHSFFMYQSDSVDALASCCFHGDTLVRIKNRRSEDSYLCKMRDLPETFLVYDRGHFKEATKVVLPMRPLYQIFTEGGRYLIETDNHLNCTERGIVVTDQLSTEDSLRVYEEGGSVSFDRITSIKEYPCDEEFCYCVEVSGGKEPYFTLSNGIVTHNCRLRNEIQENVFSYTLGAGGVKTGSKCVITLNLNRIVQDWYREASETDKINGVGARIEEIITRVHKYLNGWNAKLWDDFEAGMLPMYTQGFIDLDKQYVTCGVNGFLEAAEFLAAQNDTKYNGLQITPFNSQYKKLAEDILGTIKRKNKEARTEHFMVNTECVPAENLAGKFYNWDKRDGYVVPKDRVLYNSYFYKVEDPSTDPVAKFYYQGTGFASECDGGVALHNNLSEHLSKAQYRKLMDVAINAGCNYFTFNIPNTVCNDCGNIDKRMLHECPKCGSKNLDYLTRIIGYLKRVSNFSELRQKEASARYYAPTSSVGGK